MAGKKYIKKVTKKTYVKKAGPSSAMAALSRQVAALARVQRSTTSKVMYNQGVSVLPLGNVLADGYRVDPLTNFGSWNRTFGTDADDEQGKRAMIRNTNCQWVINSNESDPVGISMFVVSIKKVGSDLLSGGALGTLTNGTHYVGNGSKVLLNLNYFKLHYVKRFIQGAYSTNRIALGSAPAVQSIPSETQSLSKMGKFNLKYNMGKGLAVQNPSGDWKAGGYPKSDTQNYFLLTFTDNSTTDLESPYLSYQAVHTVEVSA